MALTIAACGSSADSEITLTPIDPTTSVVVGDADDGAPTTTESGSTTVEDDDAPTTEPARLAGTYEVEIITTVPHDPTAYTQGLELDGDRLLETTGLYGRSERRWVDPDTGAVLSAVELPEEFFGEGATIVNDEVLHLTWQSETLLIADGESLGETGRGSYDGEGWGLCHDGAHVIMSNGSSTLTVRDPSSFEVVRSVSVTDANGVPIDRLNELECVGDQVLANIYGLDTIAVIDPTTGGLDATIDAAALRPADAPADDLDYVLNGIAHVAETDTYYLTGKWWDVLYEVRLIEG